MKSYIGSSGYMHLYDFLLLLLCVSCRFNNKQEDAIQNIDSNNQEQISLPDSTQIAARMQQMIPYIQSSVEKETYSIPYNTELLPNHPNLFLWSLAGLTIHSDSIGYSNLRIKSFIPYPGYQTDVGSFHFVPSKDSSLISVARIKKENLDSEDQIYYADSESIIYKKQGTILAVYFKYLKKKQQYAVFLKENNTHGFTATDAELLDAAILQIRTAKHFFQKVSSIENPTWAEFKNSIHALDINFLNAAIDSIPKALQVLQADKHYTPPFDGNFGLFSIINMGEASQQLWNYFQKTAIGEELNQEVLTANAISSFIPNFRGTDNKLSIISKSKNSVIIKNVVFDYSDYMCFSMQTLDNKKYLFYTGNNANSGDVPNLYIAKFYEHFFEHYNKL